MFLKRLVIFLIGLWIGCLGIALVIRSQTGVGSWDALFVGLHDAFAFQIGSISMTVGMWSIVVQCLLMMINAGLNRKRPEFESLGTIVIRGMFLDLNLYLTKSFLFTNLVSKWICFGIGLTLLGVGIGIYLNSKFPKTPIDGLMMTIHEKYRFEIRTSRILIESMAALIAYVINGPVGLGTILMALLIGYIIQFSYRYAKKVLDRSFAI